MFLGIRRLSKWVVDLYWNVEAGIHNILRWFPVIWRSRDWDQWYIYDVLEHKLRLHADRLRKDAFTEGWEDDVADIERCVELIGKIKDDWFEDEQMRIHAERWGELSISLGEPEGEGSVHARRLLFHRDGVRTPEDEMMEGEESRMRWDEAFRQERAAKEELFGILRDKMDGWWN